MTMVFKKIMTIVLSVCLMGIVFLCLPLWVEARPLERPWYKRPSLKKQEAPQNHALLFKQGVEAYRMDDYQKAYRIWLPLARKQDPAAQKNVANMLIQGRGVEKDVLRGVRFLERAAHYGLASAQWALAKLHLVGNAPLRKDLEKALYWMQEAATLGHPEALDFLQKNTSPLLK